MSLEWRFNKVADSQIKTDPIQSEFFTSDKTAGITSGLIRESIQNSLDARDDFESPVEVRFSFKKLSTSYSKLEVDLFTGLNYHLFSKKSGIKETDDIFNHVIDYLIIEDANTSGLVGDINQVDDIDDIDSKEQSFYYFWRNVGRSGKTNQDKGRWGLGKTVFPAASRINTFFGLSVSRNDYKETFMGQSILKTHYISNNRFSPYGYLAEFGGFKGDKDFAQPCIDTKIINSIKEAFSLFRSTNPGISIIIPFPRHELNEINIVRDVIEQYYYAILNKDLIVDVEGLNSTITINAKSIINVLNDHKSKDDLKKYTETRNKIKFTAWILNNDEKITFQFESLPPNHKPKWHRKKLIPKILEENFETVIKKFQKGTAISFSVPVVCRPVNGITEPSYFNVFVQYDGTSDASFTEFIRDGITISGIRGYSKPGFKCLVIVNDKPLSTLLGDSENPAHTEWQKNSSNFRDKYLDGDLVISFVERSPEIIYGWLYVPPESIIEDLLNDFLSINEKEKDISENLVKEDNEGESVDDLDIDLVKKAPIVSIYKVNGGFTVTHGGSNELARIQLKVAYDVRRGNSFKKYDPTDFDVSKKPIKIETQGIQIQEVKHNSIVYLPTSSDYKFEIRGFDQKRDLKISIRKYD